MREAVVEDPVRDEITRLGVQPDLLGELAHGGLDRRLARLELPSRSDHPALSQAPALLAQQHLDGSVALAQHVDHAHLGQWSHRSPPLSRGPEAADRRRRLAR
uniref:hypothetical protein n=1 Tax=Rathayibacter sp. VKM Ac-2630 TaxID=1938617 RepID=UPI001F33A166|nr:hypothetical protein [Rathayibacter sp. VKM Ac-2630]